MRLYAYQPNCLACQFGLSQTIPLLMFRSKDALMINKATEVCETLSKTIKYYEQRRPTYTPFDAGKSFYMTKEFRAWWLNYFDLMRPSLDTCMDRLTENPILQTLPADRKKKGTHWQEIVAFEKFFKVNYNPRKLRQTIIDAA